MKTFSKRILDRLFRSTIGYALVSLGIKATQYRVFSFRTVQMMEFDLLRLRARAQSQNLTLLDAPSDRLHFGCGGRRVAGWLNVDVAGSDFDIDLASGALPWKPSSFSFIAAQQVIEHLELQSELLPLLKELRRVAKVGAEIWLSCPDLERVCRAYETDRGKGLIEDRLTRPHVDLGLDDVPSQHMINNLFQQSGEHRNLFDFELLAWALRKAGFDGCERVCESQMLARFPEFPVRGDDAYSLYIKAVAK